jgi:hypothetical protein
MKLPTYKEIQDKLYLGDITQENFVSLQSKVKQALEKIIEDPSSEQPRFLTFEVDSYFKESTFVSDGFTDWLIQYGYVNHEFVLRKHRDNYTSDIYTVYLKINLV